MWNEPVKTSFTAFQLICMTLAVDKTGSMALFANHIKNTNFKLDICCIRQ